MFDWSGPATQREGLKTRLFDGDVDGRRVPGVLFSPDRWGGPRPVVLICHGGSQFKTHPGVLVFARRWVEQYGFHVAAIDGPIHGDRRDDGAFGDDIQAQFRDVWWAGNGMVDEMVADWRGALDFLVGQDDVDACRVGWYGLSMGTAYGIPLLKLEPRIGCALLGMWGTDFPNSERMAEDARAVTVPCAFQMRWSDEFFPREGQFDLFDRLGSSNKTLKAFLGGHSFPAGEQFEDIITFFARLADAG